jgi:diaminopimelate epimerase
MHNEPMKIAFTKMQGAGNDFVVIDATRAPLTLSPAQWRQMADRRFGIGADQILIVQSSEEPGVDFVYRIFNADGTEVEQCGNGARCFARFVRDRGLTQASTIRVKTKSGIISPTVHANGTVTVAMGAPKLQLEDIGFDCTGLTPKLVGKAQCWPLTPPGFSECWLTMVSMGNPHAVQWVDDLMHYPVAQVGPWLESHGRFKHRVNAGFAQRISATEISLRVFERGAGETLACGTGACAAVVSGMLMGTLTKGQPVSVQTAGGLLTISWSGRTDQPNDQVMMTGPAEPVFEGVIEL